MPWIKVYTLEEATGFLKEQYDAAIKRAGRIWNIVAIMSQNPRIMKASMDFYGVMMHGPSPLSRSQRKCWPQSPRRSTIVSTEGARMRMTSVLRSNVTLESATPPLPTYWFTTSVATGARPPSPHRMWRCVRTPKNSPKRPNR